jgi:hypothetical protein
VPNSNRDFPEVVEINNNFFSFGLFVLYKMKLLAKMFKTTYAKTML